MVPIVVVDPFAPGWAAEVLDPFAERAAAGADHSALCDELFELLWPWANRLADRVVARLPRSADRHVTRSEVLVAVWQATRRISWEHPETWPAMLRQRVRGAQVDAARADDTLSRRLRRAHGELAGAIARREQQEGRHLTKAEATDLAAALWPRARHHWVELVLADGHYPVGSSGCESLPELSPEDRLLDAERQDAVRQWMAQLPEELSAAVEAWLRLERPRAALPARLRARLHPHLGQLAAFASDARDRVATEDAA
jgi:hypothetical protein